MKESTMFDNSDKFHLKCSWHVLEKNIKDAFVLEEFNASGDCDDPSEFIMLESCVLLTRPENSEVPLTIEIKLVDPEKALRKISIVSEANLVEVYGLFGEYVTTVKGEMIEEVDGTVVYSSNIDFNSSCLQETVLKFVGLKNVTKVWLFGVRLFTVNVESKKSTGFDLNRVESRLASAQLTESAEKFKRMVSDFAIRRGESSTMLAQGSIEQDTNQLSSAPGHRIPTAIKSYIDSSLKEMETRIMDRLTQKMHEMIQNAPTDIR